MQSAGVGWKVHSLSLRAPLLSVPLKFQIRSSTVLAESHKPEVKQTQGGNSFGIAWWTLSSHLHMKQDLPTILEIVEDKDRYR